MPIDDELGVAAPDVLARLEAFARGDEKQSVLPWAERLSPADRERLRGDLAVVLEEPALTGEPVDWRELGDLLQEWAEIAGWVRKRFSAAREKELSRATSRNVSSWSKSIKQHLAFSN